MKVLKIVFVICLIPLFAVTAYASNDIPDIVNVDPFQDGEGDPSVDNIRPIYPGLNLIMDDDSQLIVFNGYIDTVNSILYVTSSFFSFDGTENWTTYQNANNIDRTYYRYKIGNRNDYISSDVNICSHFDTAVIDSSTTNEGFNVINSSLSTVGCAIAIRPDIDLYDNDVKFKEFLEDQFLAGKPVQCVCALSEAYSIELSDNELHKVLVQLGYIQPAIPVRAYLPFVSFFTDSLFNFETPWGVTFGAVAVGVFGLPLVIRAIKKFF